MLLVYTPRITNRVRYTFDLIFRELLGIALELSSDEAQFNQHDGPRLAYAEKPLDDGLFFYASPLLFEKGVREQEIAVLEFEDTIGFFGTNARSVFPFDPFAATFFLVSRYEEYLPHIKDEHGRFPAEESLAWKNDFLRQPVVNIWAQKIKAVLQKHYPGLESKERTYRFIPTYDIDSAYAYHNKGLIRTVGGSLQSLRNLDLEDFLNRIRVLLGIKKDPFDTFDWQVRFHKEHGLRPIYFFLVGDYDEFDKNVSVKTAPFQSLIKSIADHADVGVHPSYASNENPNKLKKEIARLSAILKREVTRSRQHFLKLHLPSTYQNLLEFDITDDYSMGYASQVGFRAGIAAPFYFYNLDLEIKTKLKVHSFALMEATFQYYLRLSPEEALEMAREMIEAVKAVNGTFITLWHNSSLGHEKDALRWRTFYEQIVALAKPA